MSDVLERMNKRLEKRKIQENIQAQSRSEIFACIEEILILLENNHRVKDIHDLLHSEQKFTASYSTFARHLNTILVEKGKRTTPIKEKTQTLKESQPEKKEKTQLDKPKKPSGAVWVKPEKKDPVISAVPIPREQLLSSDKENDNE